ncbi:GDSL esterase/lipase At2g30310-like [Macadamia integrifolia]|uniref:GDSL esterase/lipase At2g30310-like n=1 Tax=Macadamia integrifolia TaxID=60698 RepID=UPI001C4E3AD6|nr:GDSL esterase/lipase At2g30310-like [Macadamia integrifolia]
MASSSSSFFVLLVLLNTITRLIITNPGTTCNASSTVVPPKFPAILVFGDSTVDTGNNNFIPTAFKGCHPPYGREFPGHIPTGRFSDGRLVPDLLASALGIKKLVPPFLDPLLSDKELCTGVSFASAGSGYDDLTTVVSRVIPVSQQLQYFKEYIKRLNKAVGEHKAKKIINGALVMISGGSNDFLINFYDLPTRSLQFNISGYQDFLLQKLQDIIKELFDLGCRNFIVAGVPPFGCAPIQITAKLKNTPARTCIEEENKDARAYNSKLKRVVKKLEESCEGSKMVYLNIYDPFMDMINQPQKYGFVETKKGCCGNGLVEVGPLCNLLTPPCANASEYLFWDAIHPGEVAYTHITRYVLDHAHMLFTIPTTPAKAN